MSSESIDIGPKLEVDPITLNSIFQNSTREQPDTVAVVACHQEHDLFSAIDDSLVSKNDRHLSLTYKQLNQLASIFAKSLHDAGIKRGDAVATGLKNGVEWVMTLWACAQLGVSLVSLDPRIIAREEVLKHCIKVSSVKAIIVASTEDAETIDKHIPEGTIDLKIITRSTKETSPWTSLHEFIKHGKAYPSDESSREATTKDAPCIILFTSGTTGLPKACPVTAENVMGGTNSAIFLRKLERGRKLLLQMPIFHVAGLTHACGFWRKGATVVIPAPTFDASASINAMTTEKCTDVTLVPAILQALQHNPDMSTKASESVLSVAIGGTPVSPANIATMRELFPQASIQIYFGMTEAVFVIGWSSESSPVEDKGLMSIGRPLPGCRAKICAAESGEVVKIGEVGELHVGGYQLISKYIDKEVGDFYTDDDGLRWIKTGDHAQMDDSHAVFILGRYKDNIIRGGENISPVHIENALNALEGVKSQVVGGPDEIAGEVPIAILDDQTVKNPSKPSNDGDLMSAVVEKCGQDHALGDFVRLSDLELSSFPTTASGKVEKSALKKSVAEYMAQDVPAEVTSNESIIDNLRQLWFKLLGPDFKEISNNSSLKSLADSITVMRARSQIKRQFGKLLDISDLLADEGISHQAKLLEGAAESQSSQEPDAKAKLWANYTERESMAFAQGSPESVADVAKAATATLKALGLSWETDVEDAAPANYEYLQDHGPRTRPYSWNLRRALIVPEYEPQRLREVLQSLVSLPHWSVKRSVSVKVTEDLTMVVFLKPSQKVFDLMFEEIAPVKDADGVKELHKTLHMASSWPGPWCKMKLAPIEDQNATALIIQDFHGLTDAITHGNFTEDLNTALKEGTKEVSPRIPYQAFGNMRYIHQKSMIAEKSAEWNARRLKGIGKYSRSFWPKQRSPKLFLGDDKDWKLPNGHSGSPCERKPIDPSNDESMIYLSREFSQLPKLQTEYNLAPSEILRAALVLFSAYMSKTDAGVYGQIEAGREWPFMEDWMQDALGDPFDISGGLIRIIPLFRKIDRSTKVIDFLQDVAKEQADCKKYSQYIEKQVYERLDKADRDACSLRYRMCLNWVPYVRRMAGPDYQEFDSFQHVKTNIDSDMSLVWRCGMIDKTAMGVWGAFDRCQLSPKETTDAATKLLDFVEMLTTEDKRQSTLEEVLSSV